MKMLTPCCVAQKGFPLPGVLWGGHFQMCGHFLFTEVKSHNGISHLKRTGQWLLVHS